MSLTGIAGNPAPCSRAAVTARWKASMLKNGRTASCTATISSTSSPAASSPRVTDCCRVAPPATNFTRGIAFTEVSSISAIGTITRETSSSSRKRSTTCWRIGLPARAANCFGMSPPKREPDPAAGTMTRTAMRRESYYEHEIPLPARRGEGPRSGGEGASITRPSSGLRPPSPRMRGEGSQRRYTAMMSVSLCFRIVPTSSTCLSVSFWISSRARFSSSSEIS